MVGRRFCSGLAGTALVVALTAPAVIANGQATPSPSPAPQTRAEQNASIVEPLVQIGRVRSRTPFCGALARARAGIDAAIAYEYALPRIAYDLRAFRLDSGLTKDQSLRKSEHDLNVLWELALAGRTEVQALRDAAKADGVDGEKKQEMLAFANALDGAKARQMMLAKSISKLLGTVAEQPVRTMADAPGDDHGAAGFKGGKFSHVAASTPAPADQIVTHTDTTADAIADNTRVNQLFGAFAVEDFIRDDLGVAAKHGTAAMKLGGCSDL